jgi:sialidase-1
MSYFKPAYIYWIALLLFGTATLKSAATVHPQQHANTAVGDSLALTHIFKAGKDGYACYRIPALISTNSGALLAIAEGRRKNCGDSGDIDLVMKRSEDLGKTWGPLKLIWRDSTNTCGNPAPVLDKETGEIFLMFNWNHGEDREKFIIAQTSKDTRRVFILSSKDEGKNWSAAKEITSTAKDPAWSWYATGPGHGIQLQNGPHKGRLIVPANHIEKATGKNLVSTIYSDDHGQNWKMGSSTPQDMVNECTVAELSGGKVMLNMRNYDKNVKNRQVSLSKDGGQTWGTVYKDKTLIEPICQGTLLRYPLQGNKFSLLFSNPASSETRTNMTLKLSVNDGKKWKYSKVLHAGPSAYSDMAVLSNGEIGVFFEAGTAKPYEGIAFRRVAYEELKKK